MSRNTPATGFATNVKILQLSGTFLTWTLIASTVGGPRA
jgi:hypothetical protein